MVHTFVGNDARELAWPADRQYLQSNLEFQRSYAKAIGKPVPQLSAEDGEFIFQNAFDRLLKTHGLIGSVEECLSTVEAFRQMGVGELACLIDFGIDTDAVLDSLPHLNRLKDLCQE